MIVHSLSGPSGTGKSTSALQFAYHHEIEAIIDDGILIIHGEKCAGTSAKFEKNTITAVRRAIFDEEGHRNDVKQALTESSVKAVLIIGTSDKMTKKIAKRLELGDIDHFHYIEEVRSKKEIQMAKFVRSTQGKHVMPIPYRQVEQNFFKRFIQRGFEIFSKNKKVGETTIVRPDFHNQVIHISKNVYTDLTSYVANNHEKIVKVDSVQFTMKQHFSVIYISCYIKGPIQYDVMETMRGLQQSLTEQFELHFEFEPGDIHIFVKGVL